MTLTEIIRALEKIEGYCQEGMAKRLTRNLISNLVHRGASLPPLDTRTEGQRVCDKYNALRV